MKMSKINPALIIRIANRLKKEDVEKIKFWYEEEIGEGVLEQQKTALDLLKLLKQRGELDDLKTFCEKILDGIDRIDISDELLSRNQSGSNTKFNDILDLVAQLITRDWKRLSRKLGHEEHTIEQIDLDYKKIYEKGYQSLIKWRKDNDSATWDTLKTILKNFPRNDIVREVESKFKVEETMKPPAQTEQDLSEHQENSQLVFLETKSKGTDPLNENLNKLDLA